MQYYFNQEPIGVYPWTHLKVISHEFWLWIIVLHVTLVLEKKSTSSRSGYVRTEKGFFEIFGSKNRVFWTDLHYLWCLLPALIKAFILEVGYCWIFTSFVYWYGLWFLHFGSIYFPNESIVEHQTIERRRGVLYRVKT